MRTMLISIAFILAITASAEDRQTRRNYLAGSFTFDSKINTEEYQKDIVHLEPYTVSGKGNGVDMHAKTLVLMERLFSTDSGFESAGYIRGLEYVPPAEYMFLRGATYDSRHMSKQAAIDEMDGVQIFKNGTLYFHGGLMRRTSKDVSFGIRSKSLVVKIEWPRFMRMISFN